MLLGLRSCYDVLVENSNSANFSQYGLRMSATPSRPPHRTPAHGDTAFTVPLFGGFMKRAMPRGLTG